MSIQKIVFVVGAGASSIYGYPTGAKLTEQICTDLNDSQHPCFKLLAQIIDSADQVSEFRKKFWYSETYSIDALLKRNKNYLEIGKLAIAQQLIKSEHDDYIFSKNNNDRNWYRFLFQEMDQILNGDWLSLSPDGFAFITFNYDRSLKYYLYQKLKNLNNYSDEVIAEILGNLNIIPVHGTLGPLPFESKGGRPYAPDLSIETIQAASQGIRMCEATRSEIFHPEQRNRIQSKLSNANKVFFLGFSFHPDNMEILGPLKGPGFENKMLVTTSIGLSQSERKSIRDLGNLQGLKREWDMIQVLRNYELF